MIDDPCIKRYVELLREENRRINLVSRKSEDEIELYHIEDSLLSLRYIDDRKKVVDLGSGGGLPGVPLACIRRDVRFYLVESIRKKAQFLEKVKEELNLKNVEVINDRIENVNLDCDAIVVRTVGRVKKILKWTSHLINKNLRYILYKGSSYMAEIGESEDLLKRLGVVVKGVDEYEVAAKRRFIVVLEVEDASKLATPVF